MTSKVSVKTTFEAQRTIEPIYTGGDVSLGGNGRLLATCLEEDVLIVDIQTGEHVFRIENDGEPITSLALSSSASHVVVCSRSSTMRIYGLTGSSPELQRSLKPHSSPVITSAIDATSTLLATGGADGAVKVWDIRGGFSTHTFHGHGGIISALCFFSLARQQLSKHKAKRRRGDDGEPDLSEGSNFFLASASEDGKIRIWDLQTRKSIASLDSHVSVVKSLDFSPQRQALLSASRDKTLILWDAQSWKPREVIPVLEVVEAAGFVVNGEYCYSGGESGNVRIWRTSSGKEVTKEQAAGNENDSIVSIQQSPSSLLSVHLDQTIRVHGLDILAHTLASTPLIDPLPILQSISGNHDEIIDVALVGPDRSLLAIATNTESIRIISIANSAGSLGDSALKLNSDVALLAGHTEIILCVDIDWSGHWLATGAKDNSARLWRLDPSTSSYTCFASFVGHAESLGAVALPRCPPSPEAASDPLNHPPAFLMTASEDRTIKRWDVPKSAIESFTHGAQSVSKSLYTRVAHEKDINTLDVSPNAVLFASASQDKVIKVWDLESGSVTGVLRGHKRGVWSVRFAPKDAPSINAESGSRSKGLLASGSGDRTVKIWSLSTYTCIFTLEGHSNSVLKVLWLSPPPLPPSSSADDRGAHSQGHIPHHAHPIIASASSDTLIKLWSPYASTLSSSTSIHLADDHLLATLDNHSDRVWALATPTTALPRTTQDANSENKDASSLSLMQQKYPLISGSADSRLTLWTDTTVSTLQTVTALAAERIEQDQELQNHIRAQNHREVITLALQLNHPGRLLAFFEQVINKPRPSQTIKDTTSSIISPEIDDVLSNLSHTQLYSLLLRVRDWNANARTSPVAQRVLHLILTAYPLSIFADMARNPHLLQSPQSQTTPDGPAVRRPNPARTIAELLRALETYTDRHLRRTEDLANQSYLIEYTLNSMDDVLGGSLGAAAADEADSAGHRGLAVGKQLKEKGNSKETVQASPYANGNGSGTSTAAASNMEMAW